jgi:hypothetical protein
MRRLLKLLMHIIALVLLLCIVLLVYALSTVPKVNNIQYGMSFNTPYARELGLDWKEVYSAILDDLNVRRLRLAAHWTMVEPTEGTWNFVELDTQIRMAEERGATVILAVGRRVPRWPECHVPEWARARSWEEQKEGIRTYLRTVVTRYKDSPAVAYWQVENEPFLTVYAKEHCGELDTAFLDEEIALVRSLDPSRPILVTDSGNLGLWYGAYKRGDRFGTSVYLYLWNEATGAIRTILPPQTYVLKRAFMRVLYGAKESMLIELSVEPWLDKSVVETPLETQLERMNEARFREIISYAADTRFETQYLWGAEWWYWLKTKHDRPELWEQAKPLYATPSPPASGL